MRQKMLKCGSDSDGGKDGQTKPKNVKEERKRKRDKLASTRDQQYGKGIIR